MPHPIAQIVIWTGFIAVNRCNYRGRWMFLQEFTASSPPKSDPDNDKFHGQNWTLEMVVM